MALEEYVRKRRFENTPEPAPHAKAGKPSRAAPHFYVQRHDATRLHYDFRLEVDGVLVSWAVPKGPTLQPLAKHLAAKVEDHPLEYGTFEGNIPAGNYGAGSVMLWDRGTWELLGDAPVEEQIARGDLKFRLHGEKLKGEFAIVHMKNRGKGNEWLLIKKRDADAADGWDVEQFAWSVLSGRTQQEIAQGLPARKTKTKTAGDPQREWKSHPAARPSKVAAKTAPPGRQKNSVHPASLNGAVKAAMPAAIVPMKADLAEHPPRGDEWLFEVKWDGVRAICFIERETVRLVSRTGHSCEKQYPELSVIPHYLSAGEAILDGEIAALDEKGVARFELIQPRIAQSDANAVSHMARSKPVVYFAFDLLYLNGYDLRQVALAERKQLLESVLTPTGVLRYSEHFAGAGDAMLAAAHETGIEGLMAKRATSRYESRRSSDWIKIKIVQRQEFVICGFTAGERDHFGALVLGIYDHGELAWAGNVGTGFDQKTLAALRRQLDPLVIPGSPIPHLPKEPKVGKDVTWVKPELVAEVKFANWTGDGRLRAPVYLGLRADVNPIDCVREKAAPAAPTQEPLLPGTDNEVTLAVDRHPLKFTNLNKVFYPAEGIVKRDLLNYYEAVGGLILPHLKDRPLSLKRYPNGIAQQFFFQKDAPLTFAPWLRTEEIYSDHNEDAIRYVFAQDRASLLYLVNLGCIDHNPWMSRTPTLDNPDFVLIDLDPQDCPYDMIVEAALLVRRKLDAIGLKGYPKTTGGDGMHIYIPLEPVYTYDESRTFAEILSHLVQRDRPELFTTPRTVSKRQKGRVYFDWMQNGKSKTIAAPYVLRAYPGAPVATPLDWDEVKRGLTPGQFNIYNAPARFAEKGDLFAGVLKEPQRLEEPLQELDKLWRRSAS